MERDEAEWRIGRGRLVGAGLCALAAALIAGLWSQRGPIATHFVDRALAEKGVQARYRITRFGTASQRLEHVVIGDPAHPDLVADWTDLRMSLGLNGVELHGVSAGGVRLRGRIMDGKPSFGEVDKLLPPPSGAPFALPDIVLALSDARVRLATPLGEVGLALDGSGRLTDGFTGRLAATAPRLAADGCTAEAPRAALTMAIRARRPMLAGPLRARSVDCGGSRLADVRLQADAAADPTLAAWRGTVHLVGGRFDAGSAAARGLTGTASFRVAGSRGTGRLALAATDLATHGAGARRLAIDGRYTAALSGGAATFEGALTLAGAHADDATRSRLSGDLAAAAAETPAEPLLGALGQALADAAADIDGHARLALAGSGHGGQATLATADLAARSGARLSFVGDDGLILRWGRGEAGPRFGGVVTLGGGGLPATRLLFARGQQRLGGEAQLAAFAAGGARSGRLRVRFVAAPDGALRLSATPVLDGPLGSGRVERLSLPLDARAAKSGAITVNPGCAELGFTTLAIAGITLVDGRLPLCPLGPTLLTRTPGGTFGGGGMIASPRITGHIGAQPLSIAADRGARARR